MAIEKLKLNLQHFAEPEDKGTDDTEQSTEENKVDEPQGDGSPEDKTDGGSEESEKRFTQAELDEIIKDRLKREKKKAEDEAERKRLEDQGEYKELLEKATQRLAEKEAEIAERDRKALITNKLAAKGLSGEDVQKYSKYVEKLVGEDDEVDGVVDEVYNDFVSAKQASYGDPSAGFGESKKPEQKGDDEAGRSLYQSLRGK